MVRQDDITRGLPRLHGKGDALWAGLAASSGDVVAFVDADLREFQPHFVTGLLGPLLTDQTVAFVKGFYHRPLVGAAGGAADIARPSPRKAWLSAAVPATGGRAWSSARTAGSCSSIHATTSECVAQ